MKISMPCPTCHDEALNDANANVNADVIIFVRAQLSEVVDDPVYDNTCENGHRYRVYLKNEKFEILFDMGALAFLDGYHREAVATWAAALERFHEFYSKVLWRKGGVGPAETLAAWGPIAKQSERQFGAFVSAYTLDRRAPPAPIHETKMKTWKKGNLVSFRNQVIHEGHIPTRDQAHEYGSHVLSYIFALLRELLPKDGRHALGYLQQKESEHRAREPNVWHMGRLTETIIRLWLWNDPAFATTTLEAELKRLTEVRHLRYPNEDPRAQLPSRDNAGG